MLYHLFCISTFYLALVHSYLLAEEAAKPLKILAINDMHLDTTFSDANLYIHTHNSSYVSPTGFDFKSFVQERAAEVIADMKNVSDYWTEHNETNVDAYVQALVAERMAALRGPDNKTVTQIVSDWGVPINESALWTDTFWNNPIQEICVRMLPKGTCNYDMGIYGDDSPYNLIAYVIEEMISNEIDNASGDQDLAIFVNGDFNGHGLPLSAPYPTDPEFLEAVDDREIYNIFVDLYLLKQQTQGKVPIIPTIGNNDVLFHNQATAADRAASHYERLYGVFFSGQPVKPVNKTTFLTGGYYRYDFPNGKQSVLALNTMYYKKDNLEGFDVGDGQFDWMTEQFEANSKLSVDQQREFILSMHVFPGMEYYGKAKSFFRVDAEEKFVSILSKYQAQITMLLGAHIHKFEFRSPGDSSHPDLHIPFMITSSVTPIYGNNPSYQTFVLTPSKGKTSQLSDVTMSSFQLQYYITLGAKHWITDKPTETSGFDFNYQNHHSNTTYNAANDLMTYLSPAFDWGSLFGYLYGFDLYVRSFIIGNYFDISMNLSQPKVGLGNVCSVMYFFPTDPGFTACLAAAAEESLPQTRNEEKEMFVI